jgi:DNA-binding Lrp family transcriptional regulator
MKNSRRSDRELAHAIGVSQPTITRTRRKLEEEGYIKEYTTIPDFEKLGYEILALTFVKLKRGLSIEEIEKARKSAQESFKKDTPFKTIMMERGTGLGYQGVLISFHQNYSAYLELKNYLRQFTFLKLDEIESFLISLKDEVRYRPLTFKALAEHVLTLKKEE